MPLIQWLLNLDPVEGVSVKPSTSKGHGKNVSLPPVMLLGTSGGLPSLLIAADVLEVPQLQHGASSGPPSISSSTPSDTPSLTAAKPAGAPVLNSSKTLSSTSLTSKSIAGKPTIRRRS